MAENRITSVLCSLYRITSCRKRTLTAYTAFVINTRAYRLLQCSFDVTLAANVPVVQVASVFAKVNLFKLC